MDLQAEDPFLNNIIMHAIRLSRHISLFFNQKAYHYVLIKFQ